MRFPAVPLVMICALCVGLRAAAGTQAPPAPADQTHAASAPAPAAVASAADPAVDPRVALLKLLPAGSKLEDLQPAPIPGLYEFTQGAEVSYLTADGKFFIDGNVYDMKSRANLTEDRRTAARTVSGAVPRRARYSSVDESGSAHKASSKCSAPT